MLKLVAQVETGLRTAEALGGAGARRLGGSDGAAEGLCVDTAKPVQGCKEPAGSFQH